MLARALRRPLEWPGFVFVVAAVIVAVGATVGSRGGDAAAAPEEANAPAATLTPAAAIGGGADAVGLAAVMQPGLIERRVIETPQGAVVVVPPRAGALAGSPMMTVLHGACSDVAWTCDQVAGAATADLLVACPTGNASCDSGADWQGDGEAKASWLDAADASTRALLALQRAIPGGDVLVGFSRGAFVARDVAYARPGRYRGLVLIGAALSPEPALLRANGIRRVVLAAGELDGAAPTMRAARDKLVRGGVEARFVSLGPVYHTLPDDTASRLAESLRWVMADGGVL